MYNVNPFNLLPPLKTLKGFEATARLLNVRKAADELNITHSAVSHQIQLLEAHLETKLFKREARGVTLTPSGERLYPIVQQALSSVLACTEAVRCRTQEVSLRLQVYVSIANYWLPTIIKHFKQDFPDIHLQIRSCSFSAEFDESNSDIGIIYHKIRPSRHFHWVDLFAGKLQVVCSPNLISNINDFRPENILDYPLLTVYTASDQWASWLEHFNIKKDLASRSVFVDTHSLAIEMAKTEHGIALINGPFADQALATGELIRPINNVVMTDGQWGIICKRDRLQHSTTNAFINHVEKYYAHHLPAIVENIA